MFYFKNLDETNIDLEALTEQEKKIIEECLIASADPQYAEYFFDDHEFSTIFGLTKEKVREITRNWPDNLLDQNTKLAVNNALLNLLSYPHRHWDDEIWFKAISVSSDELALIFNKIKT